MTNAIAMNIKHLPADSWQRKYAELALAKGQRYIAMCDIPDRWWDRFATEQRRTITVGSRICLPLDEFVRVALVTLAAQAVHCQILPSAFNDSPAAGLLSSI